MQEKKTDKMPCARERVKHEMGNPKTCKSPRTKSQKTNKTCLPWQIQMTNSKSKAKCNHKLQTINYKLMLVVLMFFL